MLLSHYWIVISSVKCSLAEPVMNFCKLNGTKIGPLARRFSQTLLRVFCPKEKTFWLLTCVKPSNTSTTPTGWWLKKRGEKKLNKQVQVRSKNCSRECVSVRRLIIVAFSRLPHNSLQYFSPKYVRLSLQLRVDLSGIAFSTSRIPTVTL